MKKNYENNHKPTHNKPNYKPKKQTKSYPSKQQHDNMPFKMDTFFNGNLVDNMNFGNENHELSGYVQREVTYQDRYGNKKTAKEKQFFNSGKAMNVKVYDDEKK